MAFFGNDGNLIVVAAKTNAWVTNIKMNGAVRAVAFSPGGRFSLMHLLLITMDLLRFNGDAQIIAMASRRKKNSLKTGGANSSSSSGARASGPVLKRSRSGAGSSAAAAAASGALGD